MEWPNTFSRELNPAFPCLLIVLVFSLSPIANAETLRIEYGTEGTLQIVAEVEDSMGFQLETSSNGFDWSSSSDHWTGHKIFPLPTEAKSHALYRLKIWEFLWDPVRLVIIGDSTIASFSMVYGKSGGWGQALPDFFSQDITIANQAQPGISTKIFLEKPIFLHNLLTAKPDFVLIHFGYMDAGSQREDIRTTPAEYAENIRTIVEKIRGIGGTPILCTPVTTTLFVNETLVPILAVHSKNIRQLATDLNCQLIDVYDVSFELFKDLGPEGTLHFRGSENDQLHFNKEGAKAVAALVAPLFPTFLKAYQREVVLNP